MTLNLIEKFYSLLVSEDIAVHHYPCKKDGPKFYYWKLPFVEGDEGAGFNTLEEMIDGAYAEIDPMNKVLPKREDIKFD